MFIIHKNGFDVHLSIKNGVDLYLECRNTLPRSYTLVHSSKNGLRRFQKLQDSTTNPKPPLNRLRSNPALSKLFLSQLATSKAKWAHNLLGNERRQRRDQRRKVEHNTQVLHTMERVISFSSYAFIYMVRFGPMLTTHMGQCYRCNLTLPSNNFFIYLLLVVLQDILLDT